MPGMLEPGVCQAIVQWVWQQGPEGIVCPDRWGGCGSGAMLRRQTLSAREDGWMNTCG